MKVQHFIELPDGMLNEMLFAASSFPIRQLWRHRPHEVAANDDFRSIGSDFARPLLVAYSMCPSEAAND